MSKSKRAPKKHDINEILLEAHERSIERAIETSIRTGTPLVVNQKGKVVEVHPKYKYILVPIKALKKRTSKEKPPKVPSRRKENFFSRPQFV